MKKAFFIILLMVASLGMEAQQLRLNGDLDYTQKLDSVIGTNDFGWTKWKYIFAYHEDTIATVLYQWEDSKWNLSERTETSPGQEMGYRWVDENWEPFTKTTYEYDEGGKLVLRMFYNGLDTSNQWIQSAKYEYRYNENGLLDTCLYSTIRNGSWRESERSIYSYDENQQCIGLLVQRKGGWGPFANSWMDSYRYEFEYENGELVAELYYAGGGGWFGGGEMTLDSKNEYEFDAKGNLLKKTGSIYNGEDWIVRDVYENCYNSTVNAAEVQGLEPFWQSFVQNGMGYANGAAMPLNSLWLSCSVVSSMLDTEFTLYCSGFAEVSEQQQEETFRVSACEGRLVVESLEPASVMVYDMLGRMVAQRNQATTSEFHLTTGLYIVCVGNARVKVIVK